MALDFHNLTTHEWCFSLNDQLLSLLEPLFLQLKYRTGIVLDPYADTRLGPDHQRILIQAVQQWVEQTDLNRNKQQTLAYIEFSCYLKASSSQEISLIAYGD